MLFEKLNSVLEESHKLFIVFGWYLGIIGVYILEESPFYTEKYVIYGGERIPEGFTPNIFTYIVTLYMFIGAVLLISFLLKFRPDRMDSIPENLKNYVYVFLATMILAVILELIAVLGLAMIIQALGNAYHQWKSGIISSSEYLDVLESTIAIIGGIYNLLDLSKILYLIGGISIAYLGYKEFQEINIIVVMYFLLAILFPIGVIVWLTTRGNVPLSQESS